ncbi:glucose-6-phosphate isomerase [Legionella israelensis]|uniref:glucose-6-phosphate isomerase n=1 Tax=Legionella israelensis TaxID=454 RepID=UPI00117EEF6A|nr:glucose-6-phosphate isomerase [Legionella israelensis]QDP72356.1 glucose-6-phosphate isomerase [Legionella israelensis]
MKHLSELNSWQSLEEKATSFYLSALGHRADYNSLQSIMSSCNITLNYNLQRVTEGILEDLFRLAEESFLHQKIQDLIQGKKINRSENRPALHTALRALKNTVLTIDGKDVIAEVIATREKMRFISEKIRNKEWYGFSGKVIKDIVNIGMGGSDLGPRFCIKALSEFSSADLEYHFISDADPNGFENTIKKLNPESTLFIISSKSFTTQETLYNAKKATAWIGNPKYFDRHFIAVTAKPDKAHQFGIENILPIWEWVGGRYSLCSAINLITAIAIGFEHFNELLAGARSMDEHFCNSEFTYNMPVLLALLGIWNINFLHINNLLILNYAQQLEFLVPYIQQLDMESNGKSINNKGVTINHSTGPIIWGGLGNQAQHSYYQSLCQGTHKVAADFISLKSFEGELINDLCRANKLVLAKGIGNPNNPNGYIPGNIPINHLILDDCTPFTIGALIAAYEHKVFVQSVIWDINPFDQPGVEAAKESFSILNQETETIE